MICADMIWSEILFLVLGTGYCVPGTADAADCTLPPPSVTASSIYKNSTFRPLRPLRFKFRILRLPQPIFPATFAAHRDTCGTTGHVSRNHRQEAAHVRA
jgi:hypothetical protein